MNSMPAAQRSAPWGPSLGAGGHSMPSIRRSVIVGLAAMLAILAGRLLAGGHISFGLAIVLAVLYGPLVFVNLPVAFAVYVALLFVQDTTALGPAPNAIGVLIVLAWLGTFITRSSSREILGEQARLLRLLGLFALWLALTIVWATNASRAAEGFFSWGLAMLAFLITMTTLRRGRDVGAIGVAFIAGSILSVAYGISSGALTAVSETSEAALQGRFTGGGGDPNKAAAGYLIAMFLCAGFWGLARRRVMKAGLLVAFIVVAIGFFATQSRGGMIALAVAALTGLAILPGQRKRLLGLTAAAGVGLAVVAVSNPAAITRLVGFGGGTSGRNDLWKVAWTVFEKHHWVGIGLNNFEAVESHFTLLSGTLTRVDLVAETPHLVHNLYLQLLTETGVVGFVLFLPVIFFCLRACWQAAQRFDANGQRPYADLARAALMAEIAMLSAQFFISDGDDFRLWVLLGLGPVLLSLARRSQPATTEQTTPLPAVRRARPRLGYGLPRARAR
jgi:O-antigen ligase